MYFTKRLLLKIKYENNSVHKLGMGDPTTFAYRFIYYEKYKNDTQRMRYFIMHGLVLFIRLYSYVARMFYACSFSNNTAVPIAKNNNKYFLSLNKNTTVFS